MGIKDPIKRRAYVQEYMSRPGNREKHNARVKARYHSSEEAKEQSRQAVKRYTDKLRKAAREHYGDKCACCGESIPQFLCLDHIENDGKLQRQLAKNQGGVNFYKWLKKNNWPIGLQTLCANCNLGKEICGICPHKLYGTSNEGTNT